MRARVLLGIAALAAIVVAALLVSHLSTSPTPAAPVVAPEMAQIPAGAFVMGAANDEPGREPDEGPQRRVSIRAFEASKYEITFAQWDACVAAGGCRRYRPDDEGWGRDDRPVIKVSWDDAQNYVRWLSEATGRRYRLLTEAEWEYAARAGGMGAFATGASIATSQARFDGDSTAPVGSYAANGFGLFDMHGNVWEWVEDCYAESYAAAPTDGAAVEGDCDRRVLRGGSWLNDDANALRAADRFSARHSARDYYSGFRIARSLD